MPLVHLVIGLALLELLYFMIEVGRARGRFNVPAPATTGNEMFERYLRVQMNTLEQLVIFIPSILLFSQYWNPRVAAGAGAIFLVGRIVYFVAYVKEPRSRSLGFALSSYPTLFLLGGALYGAIRASLSV